MGFFTELVSAFGADRARQQVSLAPYTTFRVGGPADYFVETHSAEEAVRAVRLVHTAGVPLTVLGGGSNVLIGDGGIRGLVIRPRGGTIERSDAGRVRVEAAVTINGLVRWTISRQLAGLEQWAGTPGTVGGGIFGNAHYGNRLLGDLVDDASLVARDGEVAVVGRSELEFAYDRSRLQRTGEILLSVRFHVTAGDAAAMRAVARRSLAHRKATQPLETPSAGCIFQNPDPSCDVVPEGIAPSAGALIDRAGLKHRRVGGAIVSPTHANFIINEGGATAADIRTLIAVCQREVRVRFGVDLREEIVYLGEFSPGTSGELGSAV